jgi:hypothetical protein
LKKPGFPGFCVSCAEQQAWVELNLRSPTMMSKGKPLRRERDHPAPDSMIPIDKNGDNT